MYIYIYKVIKTHVIKTTAKLKSRFCRFKTDFQVFSFIASS